MNNTRRTVNKRLLYSTLGILALIKSHFSGAQQKSLQKNIPNANTLVNNTNIDSNAEVAANTVNKKIMANNAAPVKDERLGFGLNSAQETIQALTNKNQSQIQSSNLIFLNKVPDQAPDGRRVVLDIRTSLPQVEKIAIMFDKNPNLLSAVFDFNKDLEPYVYTSIKMQQSGNLIVLVKSNQNWYMAKKTVKVLVGGCGA